jgi:hypothetical protein
MLVIEHVNGKQDIDIGTNRNAHNATLRGQPPKEKSSNTIQNTSQLLHGDLPL